MPHETEDFRREYERMIDRASRGDVLPAEGLTPREQRDRLDEAEVLESESLARLTALLERCVYERGGDQRAAAEGIKLCQRVASHLPDLKKEEETRSRGGFWAVLVQFILTRIGPVAPYALVIALVFGVATIPFASLLGGGRAPTPAGQWQMSYSGERQVLKQADRTWATQPSNPTWAEIHVDPVLTAQRMAPARRPSVDMDTGTDGYYPQPDTTFTPSLNSTHRLHVFTSVNSAYRFGTPGGAMRSAQGRADGRARVYTARVRVFLQPGVALPVPSPAPDAIVTAYSSTPWIRSLEFLKDSADGLYVRGNVRGALEIEYKTATWIDYSFAPLPDVPFTPRAVPLPPEVARDARIVLNRIGDLPRPTYSATVRRLHSYFAGFSVNDIEPDELERNEYLTVALHRKGVCRHRARAFFVTASAVGVETRLVENQRHSFCEVLMPNGDWRRMEFRLGDEEGPPSRRTGRTLLLWRQADSATYAGMLLFSPVLLVLIAALLYWRHRDVSGHKLEGASAASKPVKRAHRDRAQGATRDLIGDLIDRVRVIISSRLDVDLDDERAVTLALDHHRVPAQVCVRLQRIRSARIDDLAAAPNRMTGLFWDCYYVVHHFEGHKNDRSSGFATGDSGSA